MSEGKIIKLNSNNLDKCFSFWDFKYDEQKKQHIIDEIDACKRTMFVYVKNGEYVAGFSIKTVDESQMYLAYLAVREDLRNQGIGGSLIDYATIYAINNGCKKISIKVDRDNVNAKRLYERKGFANVKENSETIELLKIL